MIIGFSQAVDQAVENVSNSGLGSIKEVAVVATRHRSDLMQSFVKSYAESQSYIVYDRDPPFELIQLDKADTSLAGPYASLAYFEAERILIALQLLDAPAAENPDAMMPVYRMATALFEDRLMITSPGQLRAGKVTLRYLGLYADQLIPISEMGTYIGVPIPNDSLPAKQTWKYALKLFGKRAVPFVSHSAPTGVIEAITGVGLPAKSIHFVGGPPSDVLERELALNAANARVSYHVYRTSTGQ